MYLEKLYPVARCKSGISLLITHRIRARNPKYWY